MIMWISARQALVYFCFFYNIYLEENNAQSLLTSNHYVFNIAIVVVVHVTIIFSSSWHFRVVCEALTEKKYIMALMIYCRAMDYIFC